MHKFKKFKDNNMHEVTRIIAIRHGQTDWNVAGRLQGQTDIALNADGLAQARQLAGAMQDESMDAIFSSDLMRASQTAKIVAQDRAIVVVENPALRERHFGCFQGMTFAQIEEQAPDAANAWKKRIPDFIPGEHLDIPAAKGESLRTFFDRVIHVVDTIAAKHLGQNIVLVTHGGVLDVIYRAAAHLDIQAPRTWSLGNTSVSRLLWSPHGKLKLLSWADTSHLDQMDERCQMELAELEPDSKTWQISNHHRLIVDKFALKTHW